MLGYFLEWSIVTNVEVCMTGFPTRVPHGRLSVSLLVIREIHLMLQENGLKSSGE